MASGQHQHAIGIFPSRQHAVQAFDELRSSGFPMNKISVITKKPKVDEQVDHADTSQSNITPTEGAAMGALASARVAGLLTLVANKN